MCVPSVLCVFWHTPGTAPCTAGSLTKVCVIRPGQLRVKPLPATITPTTAIPCPAMKHTPWRCLQQLLAAPCWCWHSRAGARDAAAAHCRNLVLSKGLIISAVPRLRPCRNNQAFTLHQVPACAPPKTAGPPVYLKATTKIYVASSMSIAAPPDCSGATVMIKPLHMLVAPCLP